MCGGQLDVSNQETVVTCEYCGSKQTLPVLDNEKKQNLFNRAHRLRLASEFDKASGVFESIVSEYPEEAEAYWGLVLCTFGIEYVDDPVTKKKIPTCHRTSYESIFNDVNYDLALEYASHEALLLYRKEAKEIDRLQKEILRIASNEEPFDVFICYKETSEDGQRTKDSVLAQDMYDHLTEKGYKVFFSRITLEDKLGQEYEPYIFSALNSAKVMLVVGTKYEYFNAVWVKNEWSRFLELTKKDKSKLLIPCYADVDAYDMPNEFRNLQGQDMNKIGFMQDLIRGIKKVIHPEETKEPVYEKPVQTQTGMSPLLKRAFIFLEDEKWEDANTYCERVLDEDPENAYAYLGELLSDLQIRKASELIHCEEPFDDEPNYQKILRFGDSALIEQISGYNQKIIERKENERLSKLYEKAVQAYDSASTILHYQKVIVQFDDILTYRDSKTYIEKCKEHIKDIQNSQWYKVAESRIDGTIEGYEAAIHAFKEIEHWKDVDDRIEFCLCKIEEIKQKAIEEQREKERQEQLRKAEIARIEEQKRIERELIAAENLRKQKELEEQKRLEKERREEIKRIEEEKKEEARKQREAELLEAKRLKEEKRLAAEQAKIRRQAEKAVSENKKKPLILVLCLLLLIAGGLGTYFVLIPSMKYNEAITHLENQEYDEAYDLFVSLGDYKDSVQILNDFQLIKKYDEAKMLYLQNVDLKYPDLNLSNLDNAKAIFLSLNNFKDSKQYIENIENMILEKCYEYYVSLYDENVNLSDESIDYSICSETVKAFESLGDFKDSKSYFEKMRSFVKDKMYLAEVGDIVLFGSYEQDVNLDNGSEAIEWRVLDKVDNRLFVISEYALEKKPFNEKSDFVTWETCTLRQWLNNEFISKAFNEDEKKEILTTKVEPHKNPRRDTKQGNATQDKVFLLSIQEANQYFTNDDERCCKPSNTARNNGVFVVNDGNCYWWLRSAGYFQFYAALVGSRGSVIECGNYVYFDSYGVRPALWINLNS